MKFLLKRSSELRERKPSPHPLEAHSEPFILVADDDLTELEMIGNFLHNLGFKIQKVSDGNQALHIIRTRQPLLVVSSSYLGGMDGFKLFQSAKSNPTTESIPFVLISPKGESPDRTFGQQTFTDDYIQKPISLIELEKRITAVLRKTKQGRVVNTGAEPASTPRPSFPEAEEQKRPQRVVKEGSEPRPTLVVPSSPGGQGAPGAPKSDISPGDSPAPVDAPGQRLAVVPSAPPSLGTPAVAEPKDPTHGMPDTPPGPTSAGGHRTLTRGELIRGILRQKRGLERDTGGSQKPPEPPEAVESFPRPVFQEPPLRPKTATPEPATMSQEPTSVPVPPPPVAAGHPESAAGTGVVIEFQADVKEKATAPPGVVEPEHAEDVVIEDLSLPVPTQHVVGRPGTFADLAAADEATLLYKEAGQYALESMRRAEANKRLDHEAGQSLSGEMVESLRTDNSLLFKATVRHPEFNLVDHSVNVSILSLRLGLTLNLPQTTLVTIGLAGLLHDIGSIHLPKMLLHKADRLTPTELQEVQKRPLYSYRILKAQGPQFDVLANIAAQVHERENGQGYPQKLKGKQMLDEAKIIGLADVYEACTHHRPYRPAKTGYTAMEELTLKTHQFFADYLIKALIKSFSIYPINEYVVLNTGEIGRVVEVNNENPLRPVVEVLYHPSGEELSDPKLIDLRKIPAVAISKAIVRTELPPRSLKSGR